MTYIGQPWLWMGAKSLDMYPYRVYPLEHEHDKVPGVYIFAKKTSGAPGQWTALYIGQTHDFNERLKSDYESHLCAIEKGATHIHLNVHQNDNEEARRDEEADLIDRHKPICNKQGKG